jgi:hypothetical protein
MLSLIFLSNEAKGLPRDTLCVERFEYSYSYLPVFAPAPTVGALGETGIP